MSTAPRKKESQRINEMNSESVMRINSLDSRLIPAASRVFDECQRIGVPIYIVFGARTKQEQDFMYRFGRTVPGKILTQHRGGFSPHNYGLAIDFCLRYESVILSWSEVLDRPYWKGKWLKVIQLFKEEGWDNKVNNPSFEPGHVEHMMGNSIGNLYEELKNRNNWYQNI